MLVFPLTKTALPECVKTKLVSFAASFNIGRCRSERANLVGRLEERSSWALLHCVFVKSDVENLGSDGERLT